MKKKNYIKPTVKVIVLRHQSALLVGSEKGGDVPQSGDPDEPSGDSNPPLYNGWFG